MMAMGEFGRTPKINKDAGRDHWPGAMSILYAGGGLKMGQVIGTTERHGRVPDEQAVHAGLRAVARCTTSWASTTTHVFYDQAQRPLPILSEGEPIRGVDRVRRDHQGSGAASARRFWGLRERRAASSPPVEAPTPAG